MIEDVKVYIDGKWWEMDDIISMITKRSGKWIEVSNNPEANMYLGECSNCHDVVWLYKNPHRTFKYCPTCGSKMGGKAQNE